jgi:hypothetical protein
MDPQMITKIGLIWTHQKFRLNGPNKDPPKAYKNGLMGDLPKAHKNGSIMDPSRSLTNWDP